jgi:hypothetical protein
MAEDLGERKLEALTVVGFLITKGLLFRCEGMTDLYVLQFDCPFLIFHTIIMNALTGTFKEKRIIEMFIAG